MATVMAGGAGRPRYRRTTVFGGVTYGLRSVALGHVRGRSPRTAGSPGATARDRSTDASHRSTGRSPPRRGRTRRCRSPIRPKYQRFVGRENGLRPRVVVAVRHGSPLRCPGSRRFKPAGRGRTGLRRSAWLCSYACFDEDAVLDGLNEQQRRGGHAAGRSAAGAGRGRATGKTRTLGPRGRPWACNGSQGLPASRIPCC